MHALSVEERIGVFSQLDKEEWREQAIPRRGYSVCSDTG